MQKIEGLTLEIESLVAHLQIIGYWPVRAKLSFGSRVGVRNNVQLVTIRHRRVYTDRIGPHWTFQDMEWWELTDDAIRLIAYSLDNTLAGW